MGNKITYTKDTQIWVSMSNAATEVLADVLALAAANLARSDREIYLATWLSAALDQDMPGRGGAGFDLQQDFPWNLTTFEQDRMFLFLLINGARSKTGWSKLSYTPDEERLSFNLDAFENLVKRLDRSSINSAVEPCWVNSIVSLHPRRCPQHECFMHDEGCVMCHNCNGTQY